MKYYYVALLLICCLACNQKANPIRQRAQHPQEEAVMKVVFRLFEGMKLGDSTIVKNTFTDNPTLNTVLIREGVPQLKTGELQNFLTSVGTPHEKAYNEPIWDYEVRIDGNLAQVWTKYAFYLGSEFSHCGVDAFHLYNGPQGWKIFSLTDTRQKEGCNVPEEIATEYQAE